ncbi:hypothetical protein MPTP_1188 [Melissococcus plutonius ATCC 35311]|uniref:Uncharacterized protein n=1 Tax=Melissococcus plutonius (strain ATCC 35311 / DSM 29964 / CIP 104052 / LMG 20360 / NCIMB 702443) TaxID=940190 RepID=F3YAW1_MELPT|nr:hypothetical protein MPTP_1188 [Melissococcus plutonius ATCC 35311]
MKKERKKLKNVVKNKKRCTALSFSNDVVAFVLFAIVSFAVHWFLEIIYSHSICCNWVYHWENER